MDRTEIQEKFDAAFAGLGMGGAPPPMVQEGDGQYRRRLAHLLQPYTRTFRDLNLGGLPTSELAPIEKIILAEAQAASRDQSRGDWNNPTAMREIPRDGVSNIVEFAGSPMTWMSHFIAPARAVRAFLNPRTGQAIRINRSVVR